MVGNTSGRNDPAVGNTDAGWGHAQAGDNQGLARVVFAVSVNDAGSLPSSQTTSNWVIHPYQG